MMSEAERRVKVLDLSGNSIRETRLPGVFREEYRPDLIKRAVLAMQSHRLQPKGTSPLAGRKTSAESWGAGRGVARVPRIKNGRRAARAPQAVGGRRAHPPKTEKVLKRKINDKERRKAIRSAIAATINPELVRSRGHKFSEGVVLPIVVENSFVTLEKTADVEEFFRTIGIEADLLRARERKIRAGRGKMRGRRYKTKKSVLIVISGDEAEDPGNIKITSSARNLPGVDVSYVGALNAELLAPGTHPGRLTVWTESSFMKLGELR
ncbi:MAG: 50S ribosomal protein L4 [Methanophagales archaeon]|nr:50S ribosomal protein L4 [Methanophagales archaeon]MCW3137509.1 50S ribosomal protein L4 [Methanophagales archaeon]MCW3139553.1 50S ribosomal protein L4 [Methanophagales archaeon]MCW7072339.1 50S ribosomal protein L4 [Methanophagales archaeon]